jgi:hypothetical protein
MTVLLNTNSLTIKSKSLSEAIGCAQIFAKEGVGSDIYNQTTSRGDVLVGSVSPFAPSGISLTRYGAMLVNAL